MGNFNDDDLRKQDLNFHKKNNTQGVDKHCEAMHFKQFDLTSRMLQHTFSKVCVIFGKQNI